MRSSIFLVVSLFFIVAFSTKMQRAFIERDLVYQLQKAQIYLQKELIHYERGKIKNYTLYLAVKNYADRLTFL